MESHSWYLSNNDSSKRIRYGCINSCQF